MEYLRADSGSYSCLITKTECKYHTKTEHHNLSHCITNLCGQWHVFRIMYQVCLLRAHH